MNISFGVLLDLELRHEFYGGARCPDVEFVIPPSTASLLARGRMISRAAAGRLLVGFKEATAGVPLANLAGARLRFGLRAVEPAFANFTAWPVATVPRSIALFDNAADPTALGQPRSVRLSGPMLVHAFDSGAVPAAAAVRREGTTIATISSSELRSGFAAFDLSLAGPGLYTVDDASPAPALSPVAYYVDGDLAAAGVFAVVEFAISAAAYATPATLAITFGARSDRLGYVVVAPDYSAADLAQLAVVDDATAEDKRTPIAFERVEAADAIADALGSAPGPRALLFRATTPVSRQHIGRRRIQLRQNGDIIIKSLPQLGASGVNPNLIVHLSKTT